ncbi:hypothetical protein JZX86_18095 [Agrobacterium rosae]|uniref:hypothetical protein n=1 Tax=Agrobacterium rosae TaxID=1972867 RepID=UPI0019D3D404|nr:hypothetical protein [Agrobacterium rosae]MBN7807268.1 hypothetical protein [Agrobacterium rosae]
MSIQDLIKAAADAASQQSPAVDVVALVKHGFDARAHVWERHYASTPEREQLAEKLAASTPEFQLAVALTEKALADELADDNARRDRVRAENPSIFKD